MSRITFRSLLALLALAMLVALPATASAKKHSRHGGKAAHKADRNRDGLPDRWERRNHLSLRVNQAGRDQDRDGANNAAEYAGHTNPRDHDSDDDGMSDGSEDVGTVVSFTDGTLVITAGGLPVSGKVTADTEIKCAGDRRHHEHGDDEGDDAHGSSRGDDGEHGDGEHGDDDRGDDDRGDCTGGGLPGGTAAGLPTGGGMPTSGGLPGAPVPPCTIADLKPGAIVHEAELKLTANGPVWDEITLVRPTPPATG